MAKNSYSQGGKQGFGGRMPPQTNLSPLALMAQRAQQAQQVQRPQVGGAIGQVPVKKGQQFGAPPSGGKGGLGGGPMPQQVMAQQQMMRNAAMQNPQMSGNKAANKYLANALGNFRDTRQGMGPSRGGVIR